MFRIICILIFSLLILHGESFVLVTHPKSPIKNLTKSQAKSIYLKERRFWGDTKLTTLNLPPDNPLRKAFESDVLEMTPGELDSYWMKQHYRGHRPPYRVESVQSILMFVKKVEGAIGYIPQRAVTDDVKVIYKGNKR
ncbi:hypothetical protein PGH07_05305 [Sulfurovum sp. zt1-1]|uniref:Phosphate ABC transporter substrate-binding protein n=1 Tax=Sulfurovum zhangzhouensis TaxID=3019067 RepID=A0ABT7QYJ5_9BACT|nr:hypothetical protein [Sulfurovum zhangzhouensis]MDM5271584.1 hypothetical protein [Sulfurovum zhangzhouensis]